GRCGSRPTPRRTVARTECRCWSMRCPTTTAPSGCSAARVAKRFACRRGPQPRTPRYERKLMRVWPGQPYPLGATWDGQGVNFAIFSENATGVELCLFDHPDDAAESFRY